MRRFKRYWFGSATPEILIKKLQDSDIPLSRIDEAVDATEEELEDYTPLRMTTRFHCSTRPDI